MQRYEVIETLGKGGMAELQIARTIESGRLNVVKRIRADSNSGRTRKMFIDEIRITASLHHPNVIAVRDCNALGDDTYLVMEYVHGKDLRKILAQCAREKSPLPIDHSVAIVAAGAAGLQHAHELRGHDGSPLEIVHRDVSLTNIVVGYDGSVKIIDFGIAKSCFSVDEPSIVKGKTAYLAPEQCLGRPVDRRTDVFALGIVAWEMVATARLFARTDDVTTMREIVHGTVPSPRERRPELSRELEAVIMRALAREPDDRYPTAEAFREALLGCIGVLPDETRLSTMMQRFA